MYPTIQSTTANIRRLFTVLVLTGISLLTYPLFADECSDILKQGIYDELNIKTSNELTSTFKSLLSMDLKLLERTSKQGGKEGRLAISLLDLLNVEAGGSTQNKEQKLKQLHESFRSNHVAFFKSSSFTNISKRTVNESIVKAWSDCMSNNSRHVTGWYADDPLSAGRVTVKFSKPGPDNQTRIAITSVTPNNLVLVPLESGGFFKSKLVSAIRPGRSINLGEVISAPFQRMNPDKPASIVVSFGSHGAVDLQFPAQTVVPPPPTKPPLEFPVSFRVEKIGAKRISGGDSEMDTNPGDVVTCTFSSELEFDADKVWISADYTCEEYRGNHTKLGASLDDKVIFTAPSGMKIVGVEHAGEADFTKNPPIRGRNHGFVEIKLPKATYWKSLDFRVDSSAKNDAPSVGFKGVVGFTVKLANK